MVDVSRRSHFEAAMERAAGEDAHVRRAAAIHALNVALLPVVLSACTGRALALALALARSADPTALRQAGFADLVSQADEVVDAADEAHGGPALSADERQTLTDIRQRAPVCRVPGAAEPPARRSDEIDHAVRGGLRDQFLQSPSDRLLRGARPRLRDEALLSHLDGWLAGIDDNYARLAAGAERGHGDVVAEVCIPTASDGGVEVRSPAWAQTDGGEIGVATSSVVDARGLHPQPDGIAAQPGDLWRVCGHVLADGTLMACRGTYRVRRGRPAAEHATFR